MFLSTEQSRHREKETFRQVRVAQPLQCLPSFQVFFWVGQQRVDMNAVRRGYVYCRGVSANTICTSSVNFVTLL